MSVGRPAVVGKAMDELPQLSNGFAELVRDGLGITASASRIMDLPLGTTEAHDEADSGRQELYVALHGSGAVVAAAQHSHSTATTSSACRRRRAGALASAHSPNVDCTSADALALAGPRD